MEPDPGIDLRDAGTRLVDWTCRPVLDRDGTVLAIVVHGTDVTARIRAQEALRAGSERAEAILSVLGDGFVSFDRDFRIERINAAALAYDGRQEHEIVGKTHWEAWPNSAGSALEDAYRRVLREGVQISVERHYRGSGKESWLDIRICPVLDGIVSFYQDITERKTAVESLRASEERFRALAEALPHQVWEIGTDGRIAWCNGHFHAFTGLGFDDVASEVWQQVVHPDDLDAAETVWHAANRAGGIFQTEVRLRRALDGTYRWFLSRGVPLRNAEGATLRWIGTNTDIHDQRVATDALAAMNAGLSARVEARTRERDRMWRLSTDLMLIADHAGTIVAANPAWEAALGWPDGALPGSAPGRHRPPRRPGDRTARPRGAGLRGASPRWASPAGQVVDGAGPWRGHRPPTGPALTRMLHRDGSFRRFSWTAVLDEVFVHAVGRDVTSEVEAAEALRKAEEALHHSQKMEAVGQLTGGIAHDFNNLLTGVIGSLDLIQTGAARGRTDRLDHYVNTALGSAKRAAALTHRLLAFSRRQPLARKSVEIGELVRSMSDLLRRTVREAIRIESSLEDGAFHTLCDPNQLENALLNLVINARDAIADDGTIRIHARTVMPDDPLVLAVPDLAEGCYVALSVTDSGTGMPSDVLAKAFEPFFTTKPIGHGTGLGLSMVYGFARQSGGSVLIRSEVDSGTTVTLFLPSHPPAEAPAEPKPPEPPAAPTPTGARTILVVEDEPTVRSLVVDMLKDAGFEVLEAGDGHEGLQRIHSEARIDLLLSDVGLPKLNGRQLAEAARDHRPGIRILLMTGYLGKALPADLPIGSDMDIIPKPFTREALIARLTAILSEGS